MCLDDTLDSNADCFACYELLASIQEINKYGGQIENTTCRQNALENKKEVGELV